ncbi:MAG: flagellar protein FlgN [Peptococcaceae bacterium]|jgi:flagellar biosynthesis/type III secretory pathway chaperone|nr:flagellar protein FlgN [Peptococcaceae bacterium]
MVNEKIAELNTILSQQVRLYCELKSLSEKKKAALVKNDIQELAEIVILEEQLILSAGVLERERLVWAERFLLTAGQEESDLTLAELAEAYPELGDVHEELKSVVGELQLMHESNKLLLNQAIKIMNYTVNLFNQADESVYLRPGSKKRSAAKLKLLDKQI